MAGINSPTIQNTDFYPDLELIRTTKPLIEEVVNKVALNDAVNVVLSLGCGSPRTDMTFEDLEETVCSSTVVYINGGVDSYELKVISEAARLAQKHGVPVVLDPVAAGASKFRTRFWLDLLRSHSVAVVKGNSGEISALLGAEGAVRGVDSLVEPTKELALKFSERFGVVAAVTGRVDYVASAGKWAEIKGGTRLFEYLTGTGCMAGAVLSAFLAVDRDAFRASVAGLATFKAAGSLAAKKSRGPGSFRANLLDALYNFKRSDYAYVNVRIGGL